MAKFATAPALLCAANQIGPGVLWMQSICRAVPAAPKRLILPPPSRPVLLGRQTPPSAYRADERTQRHRALSLWPAPSAASLRAVRWALRVDGVALSRRDEQTALRGRLWAGRLAGRLATARALHCRSFGGVSDNGHVAGETLARHPKGAPPCRRHPLRERGAIVTHRVGQVRPCSGPHHRAASRGASSILAAR